jgi:peroxiredoxin family protein
MPMPVPMPNFVQILPGMEWLATWMMKRKLTQKGVVSIEQLRDICLESGVEFIACQMTVDLFDFTPDMFVDEVSSGGAATFLEFASNADMTLYL